MSPAYREKIAAFVAGSVIFAAAPCQAGEPATDGGFISSWLAMVGHTQDEQPHWMTPLATVTPRLEQEFRFDMFSEDLASHGHLDNYGGAKGLEFIPSENTEIIIGVPPYETRTANDGKTLAAGWGDWPALLVKYRFLSANEESGNYIVTGFLQFSAPTGQSAFTNRFYVVQPTIAFGKGWGDFDLQATIGEQFPAGGSVNIERTFGQPVLENVAAQYHIWEFLWPELEANSTWWPNGSKAGKLQLFLTPGIIFGRFTIRDRVKLILGAGYQISVSPHAPAYKNDAVLTLRTTF